MRPTLLVALFAVCATLLLTLAASSFTGTEESPGKVSTIEQPATCGGGCPYLEQQAAGAPAVCPYLKGKEEGCPAFREGTPRCPRAGSGSPGQHAAGALRVAREV